MNKRKCWLIIGLVYAILSPILLARLVTFVGAPEPFYVSWTLFWMAANLMAFFFLWKCAYKKPGTKLITLYLIIAPFIALNIFLQLCGVSLHKRDLILFGLRFGLDYYKEKFNSYPVSYLNQNPWNVETALCTMGYVVLFALFYYFCLCLRKKNKSKTSTKCS